MTDRKRNLTLQNLLDMNTALNTKDSEEDGFKGSGLMFKSKDVV